MFLIYTRLKQSGLLFCLLALPLVSGCFKVYQGRYEAEKVKNWNQWYYYGSPYFQYPTKKTPDWFLHLAGQKGTINIRLANYGFHPDKVYEMVEFDGTPIRIVLHDRNNEEMVVPPDRLEKLGYYEPISVGDSEDFTVVVPSFRLANNVVPELRVRLRWNSKGTFVEWIPMQ